MNRPNEDLIRQTVEAVQGYRPAARKLRELGFDVSESGIRRMFKNWSEDTESAPDFEIGLPGGKQFSIDPKELIKRRIAQYTEKKKAFEREKLIPIGVKIDGPIGLGFMGDPHVDDDGTDLEELFSHVDLFDGRNEGLYAGCIGDAANNWVGGLARLWSEQSTSAAEARVIVTEFLTRICWLFYIHGNHDVWNGGNNLINAILGNGAAIKRENNTRLDLRFPNGKHCRIYAAHTFPGKSMWSEVYGAAKKAQLDGTYNIFASGHIHTSGYAHGFHESNNIMWHAIQIASYKKIDRYADELGLDRKDLYNCPVALIDPYAKDEINFIRWEFDPHEGAERLKWMRSRYNQGKSSS